MQSVSEKPKRAVVAAVHLSSVSDVEFEASVTELGQLAKTLGFEVVATFTQKRPKFDSAAYLGLGKRLEMRSFLRNEHELDHERGALQADEEADASERGEPVEGTPPPEARGAPGAVRTPRREGAEAKKASEAPADPETRRADVILVDHEISPSQARNLEKEVGCEVMDRTMVILEIFHRHARSREARAQVEIARLGYMAPRLREAAKIAGPQGRQRSGIGGRGAGESQNELDRRKIRDRIAELREELVAMDVERKTQRSRRQERQGLAHVALVGYTNAGKSTLMRALTGSDVLVADKLFATLDTTVRALHPESVPRVLVEKVRYLLGFARLVPSWPGGGANVVNRLAANACWEATCGRAPRGAGCARGRFRGTSGELAGNPNLQASQ